MKNSFLYLAMQVNKSLQKRLANASKLATSATEKVAFLSEEDSTTAHGSTDKSKGGSNR